MCAAHGLTTPEYTGRTQDFSDGASRFSPHHHVPNNSVVLPQRGISITFTRILKTFTFRWPDLMPARKFLTSSSASVEVFATKTREPSKCRLPGPVAMGATQVKRQHGTH
ncbi:hypothetical protein L798_04168 [Zootermopsis nevadensis]|uniref:Uncharacterized protein n=1 Tax=Zootermopsis nevadensis TaxID=136037 RepID=A0A067RAT1_ZOONE|nr:hypothetical protein L798_04168 [Zootermopsis nevadensis]